MTGRLLIAMLLALVGCDDGGQNPEVDGGPTDAGVLDAAAVDAGTPDPDSDPGADLDVADAIPDTSPPAADPDYDDLAHWICHPEKEGDPCDGDLSATIVHADGRVEVEPFVRAEAPPVDCFYVYPTVSLDRMPNADLPVGEEEHYIVVAQAARFASVCTVFAPAYRQVTVGGLAGAGDAELAYGDVLHAFQTFAARDPQRPFFVIGHSQGSSRLERLLREQIEADDALHGRLVGAYLIGWNVALPEDADVGGSFQRTPACRSAEQTGCVVSFATYRETDPPTERSLFAHVDDGRALCNHPGATGGGAAFTRPYFDPALPAVLRTIFRGFDGPYADAAANEAVGTRFYSVPDLVEAECVTDGPYSYLEVRIHADPDDPVIDDVGGDFAPGWGLHLADITLLYGDLVDLAATQTAAWLAR